MPSKEIAIKHSTVLIAYLLIIWGFYRFLFKLPEEVEEIFIKPILWLIPVFILVRKEKASLDSLGLTSKNLFPAIYLSLVLGSVFAIEGVIINLVRYGTNNFSANLGENTFFVALTLSLITAFSEEITFRGYLFKRIFHAIGNEWAANLITSLFWALVHIPIAIFWWHLEIIRVVTFLFLMVLFGIGSAFVFVRTGNIFSSILLHFLWSWPIILFR